MSIPHVFPKILALAVLGLSFALAATSDIRPGFTEISSIADPTRPHAVTPTAKAKRVSSTGLIFTFRLP